MEKSMTMRIVLKKALELVEHHLGDSEGDECGILAREIFADVEKIDPDLIKELYKD